MEKAILVKDIIENYFKENPTTKDVIDMTLDEARQISAKMAEHVADKVISIIETMTVADIYDIQMSALPKKTDKPVETIAEVEEPVLPIKKKRGRPKGCTKTPIGNYKFYVKRADIPDDVDSNCVYMLAERRDGMKLNARYAIARTDLPGEKAKNLLKTAYAKHVNTNYLNVTVKLADNVKHNKRLNPNAKFFGNYTNR